MLKRRNVIRSIPFLFVIIAIFLLTTQDADKTMSLSNSFRDCVVSVAGKLGIALDLRWWSSSRNVRHIGHIIEYFALGIAAGILFDKKWRALILCVCISIIDQVTKIFVPIRYFDLRDISFDFVGIVVGAASTDNTV